MFFFREELNKRFFFYLFMVNGKQWDLEWTERDGFVLSMTGEKPLYISTPYILYVFV